MRTGPIHQSHSALVTDLTPITQVWGSPDSLQLPWNDVQGPHPPPKTSAEDKKKKNFSQPFLQKVLKAPKGVFVCGNVFN